MDKFSGRDLRALIESRGGLHVSIFLPTQHGGREMRQNTTYFENMLRRARTRLAEHGVHPTEIDELLEPARKSLGNKDLWQHPDLGLAVFLSRSLVRFQRSPERFEERLYIGERFYTKPLFPLVHSGDHFYVLALSKNSVRLFRADRSSIEELHPEGLPRSFDDALGVDQPATVTSHTLGGSFSGRAGATLYHGHGSSEQGKGETYLFCRRVDQALRPLLAPERPHLVLAAVEELWPLYRQANSCARLVEGIPGNPDAIPAHELHARSWERFSRQENGADHALAAYERLAHPDRASDRPEIVIPAAVQGRVSRLLVASDRVLWGRFDPVGPTVFYDGEEGARSDDLCDFAAAQTWLHGGEVFVLPAHQLPFRSALAATFRY
jgi:hypothetical protein